MPESILQLLSNPELQKFVFENEQADENALILKHKTIYGVPASLIADQIVGRRKAKNKIPKFYNESGIIYPPGLNLEQCSSEVTAKFKADLIKGEVFADLTGGFGIDSLFFSKNFNNIHYIERNHDLLEIARYNHRKLGASNIQYYLTSAEEFLDATPLRFDNVYIDPSRRVTGNKKVFILSECEPNVVSLQKTIFEKSDKLMVKTSPLLDIRQGLRELQFVQNVFVISVENECKEILFLSTKNFEGEPSIEAVNISSKGNEIFSFNFSNEENANIDFSNPLQFLYEPHASILKAGAFKLIGNKFNLCKIHPSTHLYTSNILIADFPGRIFKIEAEVKPDQKTWSEFFPEGKANITTRNYPLSPDDLKKRIGLKDGGKKYLIGFSGLKSKYLVVAERIQ